MGENVVAILSGSFTFKVVLGGWVCLQLLQGLLLQPLLAGGAKSWKNHENSELE